MRPPINKATRNDFDFNILFLFLLFHIYFFHTWLAKQKLIRKETPSTEPKLSSAGTRVSAPSFSATPKPAK